MQDNTDIANEISRWTGRLGVKLPDELNDLIEIFETLSYADVGHRPQFDVRAVTAENAERMIYEFAAQVALSGRPGAPAGSSPLDQAKAQVVDIAARNVAHAANSAVGDVIDQLAAEFLEHVEAYVDAVEQLPETIDSESLLAAGPGAVSAYQDALREAAHMNGISSWVADTAELSLHSGKIDPALHILHPDSVTQLFALDETLVRPASLALNAINPLFVTAVREGVSFKINTIRGCAAIRSKLTTIH